MPVGFSGPDTTPCSRQAPFLFGGELPPALAQFLLPLWRHPLKLAHALADFGPVTIWQPLVVVKPLTNLVALGIRQRAPALHPLVYPLALLTTETVPTLYTSQN